MRTLHKREKATHDTFPDNERERNISKAQRRCIIAVPSSTPLFPNGPSGLSISSPSTATASCKIYNNFYTRIAIWLKGTLKRKQTEGEARNDNNNKNKKKEYELKKYE